MKKRNKILGLMVGAVALVGASVMGTMAYLTSQDTVTNTFTVGKVNIKLDEADVDELGNYEYKKDEQGNDVLKDRVKANEYHLLPGHTYVKDPTVTVLKGSEESYVRMILTINEQADLDKIFAPDGIPLDSVLTGGSESWKLVKETKNDNDTRSYEFRYSTTVTAKDADVVLPALFQNIVIPKELTEANLKAIEDLQIDVVAHAIQVDSFTDADKAWEAFDGQ